MTAYNQKKETEALEDRVIDIARVAKVVKGGRRFSFSALVVVGDGKEGVGFGVGKAGEVPDAIRKGSEQAKKNLLKVPTVDGTIPFEVEGVFGSSRVVMYPAKKGKGIIAGGAVRTIVELGGIRDIVCKIHGSRSHHNVVRATMDGIKQLISIEDYAAERGKTPAEVQQIRHEQVSDKIVD
ncbi:MAG: 30S ribosomal protein S5 [Bdellovibrionota bacterium]